MPIPRADASLAANQSARLVGGATSSLPPGQKTSLTGHQQSAISDEPSATVQGLKTDN